MQQLQWKGEDKRRLSEFRRTLHRIPELEFDLFKTQAAVLNVLRPLQPDTLYTVGCGVVAVFRAPGESGKALAFRADMDALPIAEQTGLAFASLHPGAMHACGHDGHMACLLELAHRISHHREILPCDAVLIFQPGEEGSGGAVGMIQGGCLTQPKVQAIFGLHIMPHIPQGTVAGKAGVLMAQTEEFNLHIHGKAGHASRPHECVDAIVAAGALLQSLQTVVSRSVNPLDAAVVTIGKLTAGEARNIVAQDALLEGTMRSCTLPLHDLCKGRIQAMCMGLEEMYGVTTRYEQVVFYPAVDNDEQLYTLACRELGDLLSPTGAIMASEDFSFYQQEVPGLFLFLGCRNPQAGYVHALHAPQFDFDEAILRTGVETLWTLLLAAGAQ